MAVDSSEKAWNNLKSSILETLNKYAPVRESTGTGKNQPWMNSELKVLVRKKAAVKLKRSLKTATKEEWREAKMKVKNLTWTLKKQHNS